MLLSVSAFAVAFAVAMAAMIGTDTLGRPLTNDEKRRFGRLLREHNYPDARIIALRFAYRLTRARTRAQDLMGRVDLRLVRLGWDPKEVSLERRLCRLVWSEWTHAVGETDKARQAEETFLRERKLSGAAAARSVEEQVTERTARDDAQALAKAQLAKLRATRSSKRQATR
jgi:hypothetical protein